MNIDFTDVILWTCYFLSMYFSIFWLIVLFENNSVLKKEKPKKFDFKKCPKVTIVLPAWNEEHRGLRTTIESVLKLNYPKSKLEIIAIDHGSTDNTLKIMNEYSSKITVLHISRTKKDRKGVPMNVGLKMAKGDYFVCMDCDSSIESDALYKLLPEFEDEKIACVLPMMKAEVNTRKRLEKFQHFEYLINLFYKKIMGFLDCIHVAPGPFSIYRTEVLRSIGGYDNYNLTEDLEITIRLQKYGYRIKQTIHTVVTTLVPNTFKDYVAQRRRWFSGGVINAIRYKEMLFNKKYGDFGLIQMPILILSGVMALTLIGLIVFMILKNLFTGLYNLYLINFDLWIFFETFKFNFNYLNLSFPTIVVMIFTISITSYMMYNSFRSADEGIRKHGIINLIFFLGFYFFFLAYVWIEVVRDLLTKRVIHW